MTTFIEKLAVRLGLIPDDWVEFEPRGWPAKRIRRRYDLVPTTCFNCESACGLLAYVDKETGEIRKFEGNPLHPASRGRLCAKGPATINQIKDPDRILYPLRRVGKRGEGKWEKISWHEAQHLFVGSPVRLCHLARLRSPQSRSRQRRVHPADLRASGVRALFQSARSANHRRQIVRSQAGGDGPAAVEHRVDGRLLAAHAAGNRGRRAAGHGPRDPAGRTVRRRLPQALGQLGRCSSTTTPDSRRNMRRKSAAFRPRRSWRWPAASVVRDIVSRRTTGAALPAPIGAAGRLRGACTF